MSDPNRKKDDPGKYNSCPFGVTRSDKSLDGSNDLAHTPCVPECKFARQRPANERWKQSKTREAYDPRHDFDCLFELVGGEVFQIARVLTSMMPANGAPHVEPQPKAPAQAPAGEKSSSGPAKSRSTASAPAPASAAGTGSSSGAAGSGPDGKPGAGGAPADRGATGSPAAAPAGDPPPIVATEPGKPAGARFPDGSKPSGPTAEPGSAAADLASGQSLEETLFPDSGGAGHDPGAIPI